MEGQEASLGHAGSHPHANPDDLLKILLHAEVQGVGGVLAQALIHLQACCMSHRRACLGNGALTLKQQCTRMPLANLIATLCLQ